MQIGRKDVFWNYCATFLQLGVALLIFPFILHALPSETVAIWIIFLTITALINLLDFGFNPSFMRNVSYVFSGARKLKSTGFYVVEDTSASVDWGLLKGLIGAMRFFYSRMAIALCVVLITIGSYYVYTLLKGYSGNHFEVYLSWIMVCCINSYSFYTLYYDSLLLGKGMVTRAKQITIIGHLVYLFAVIVLILLGFGLVAIVSAQALSVIIKRVLSYRSFYTVEIKDILQKNERKSQRKILKAIYPNAIKIGITSVGGFLVSKSAIILGSLYLSLEVIASYGITIQVITIIAGIATVYFSSYQPKMMQYRIQNNIYEIKRIYLKTCFLIFFTYIIGGAGLLVFGDWALNLIDSKTLLLNQSLVILALFLSFVENNISCAGGFLLTKNDVPFFKAAIISGLCIVIGILLVLKYMDLGVLGLLFVPLSVHISYSAWKWPWEVIKDLQILNKS